ncbi:MULTISPECIES: phage portal protein [Clostridium]|uniref:phage portal protein n=1 Tax=Clostridium TaxID=1485 RepID=UPI0032EBD959
MGMFKKKLEARELTLDDLFVSSSVREIAVNRENALEIPVVKSCVNLISSTICSLPVKLYKEQDGKVVEVINDNRIKLLNSETGDLLDSYQMKEQMILDYLLYGQAYSYIKKEKNKVTSLHHVKKSFIIPMKNTHPIFKDANLSIGGKSYEPWEFIQLLKDSKDGVSGKGILDTNPMVLKASYYLLNHQKNLSVNGGVHKGIIKSLKKLSQESIDLLKENWRKLYSNNSNDAIILNEGLEYVPVSANNKDMQTKEQIEILNQEICSIFNVPYSIVLGKATKDEYDLYIKSCIVPILKAFENALNRTLLLESEKESLFWEFDLSEINKANVVDRYKAHEIALKNGIKNINEVRYEENLDNVEGLDFIRLSLADVLLNPKDGTVYTPNTNETTTINNKKSVVESEVA